MNYWPLSVIRHSPQMSFMFAHELAYVYATCYLSPATFQACGEVARHTQPMVMPELVVIESLGTAPRYAFTSYPSQREWERLERGGIIEASNGMLHIIIDALH